MRAVHVSFATPKFSQASKLLQKTARRFGLDSHLYTPVHPIVLDLAREYPSIMSAPRGAGYWLWKPFIILDMMDKVPDGTPILYTDAALTFIADPAPMIALTERHPVCLFVMTDIMRQGKWTKRDCFIEMDADTEEFWALPQLAAGVQLYRTGPQARHFVSLLAQAMASEARLTDMPNIHGLPNLPDFVDHRHDQSVLTILAKQQGAALFRDPSQFGEWYTQGSDDAPFRQTVFLHRRRDRPLYKWLSGRLRQKYTGGKGFI
ncbi:hypothetical protein [Mesorhizobium sp. INR15]|uniref:hypothetical protein n=1 Tax=Mesorhizobium sp. INR15 TaxID=2654248 RepID=UPI0018965EE1|nr:hypothetical protein [Mesorhizobium sp. INR15]QPC93437.1 hypothetical protein GA829_24285 [Mesorhizobium sp. INR15]